jgi:hypothetical protein
VPLPDAVGEALPVSDGDCDSEVVDVLESDSDSVSEGECDNEAVDVLDGDTDSE